MDAGLSIRPLAGVAEASYVQPAPAPVRGAVATDLAPAQTVTAAAGATAAHNDAANTPFEQPTTNDIVIDPATREVIYRVVDVRSNRVVRQVPDQALLRMKVYTRAIANGESPNEAAAQADLDLKV